MERIQQTKIPVHLNEEGELEITQPVERMNWRLVRERDGLVKQSRAVKWVEWNENRTYKADFEEIKAGRSLIMSPFNLSFTWQTTPVTEIVITSEGYIKFRTGNSTYELSKI